jgi:hypothetical protein
MKKEKLRLINFSQLTGGLEMESIEIQINFEFLMSQWIDLYDFANAAQKNIYSDPCKAHRELCRFGESFIKHIFTEEGLPETDKISQLEKTNFLQAHGLIPIKIYEKLNTLRKKGSKASHGADCGSIIEAKESLNIAFQLGVWLTQVYGDWDSQLSVYIEPTLEESDDSLDQYYADIRSLRKHRIKSTIITFKNNDLGYEKWLKEHPTGYVFNYLRETESSADMNKIHRADCRHLLRCEEEGKLTTVYEKICSSSLIELEAHVYVLRGSSWEFCKSCM